MRRSLLVLGSIPGLLIVIAASALTGASHEAPRLLAATQEPVRIELSGQWDFRFDPDARGESAGWFAVDNKDLWKKAKVPGSFNEEFATNPAIPELSDKYRFYKGKVWYRTRFPSPKDKRPDIFLHFAGTVLRQKVWLNGKYVGASNLPWLDVSYDVTALLDRGGAENTLVVEVDNSVLQHAIPDTKWRGWWDDGGLIRPVYLEERQRVRSASFAITTLQPDGSWQLEVESNVHQDVPEKASLNLTLTDSYGRTVWHRQHEISPSTNDARVESVATLRRIHAWSPDDPALYRLTVKTNAPGQIADVNSFRVGFRQISVKGSQILLNDKPIILRGISRHEFAIDRGQSLTVAQNRKDMQDIKALGANFVRLAHYSQSQDVYDDCDELGLLVWTEIPAWQTASSTLASSEVWRKDAAPQLEAMVKQHRNHPSVIVWSVANEIPSDQAAGAAYIAKAIAYVHGLDPTRLATFASDRRERDISLAPVDIIAVNEYYGWYYGKLDEVGPMLDRMHAKYPDKPILVSEFGAEAVAGWNRQTARKRSKDYSYDHQVQFLSVHLAQIFAPERRSYVAGGTIWVYNDFPDPHRVNGDHPEMAKYRNNKGLVTMDRTHKPAYATVKHFYTGLEQQETARPRQ